MELLSGFVQMEMKILKDCGNRIPLIGQTRVVTKFLWFPKTINKETRWLEKASWTEHYLPSIVTNKCSWITGKWND